MPASIPGSTLAQNIANPSLGQAVLMNPLSGPKGSPFDRDNAGNASTGALSNGIGFGTNNIMGPGQILPNFSDDATAGLTLPNNTAASNSRLMFIGGGRSVTAAGVNPAGEAGTDPYTAGFAMCSAGQGGSRDAGAGPAFTGFANKVVTATATVANGVAVEAGFLNRSGVSITTGQSVFGSATAANAAPA